MINVISPENPVMQLDKIPELTRPCFAKVRSAENLDAFPVAFNLEKSSDLEDHRAWFEMVPD